MIINCPSGLVGEGSRFGGDIIQTIADRLEDDDVLGDAGMADVLNGCWERIEKPGPYPFLEAGDFKPQWKKLLRSDVLASLLYFRVGSFRAGADYTFKAKCPACRKRTSWGIDLKKEMLSRIRPLNEAGIRHVQDGTPITVELEDGTAVGFQLMTMEREAPVNKLRKAQLRRKQRKAKRTNILDQVAGAIVSIDGKLENNIAARHKWLVGRDLQEVYDIRDAMEDNECGLDTEITVQCQNERCEEEFDVELPLGPSFLDPSRASRRERLFGIPGQEKKPSEISEPPPTDS